MITIDLITGFLGSGKTTFIKKYASYLVSKGEKVCVIENDFGAINIDTMLLDNKDYDIESVIGGDVFSLRRRFRTKLITIMMKSYTRVIVEPSGLYDTDEFFDPLYEEPLINNYKIGNIFSLIDINDNNLTKEEKYFLVNETAHASKIIVTKRKGHELFDVSKLNQIHKEFDSTRNFDSSDILYNESINFNNIINSGYKNADFVKRNYFNNFDTMFIMNQNIKLDFLKDKLSLMFSDLTFGNIIRVKGFIKDKTFVEINATEDSFNYNLIDNGQLVIIIIGINLNKELIYKTLNVKSNL
jgi:G3E family GTPase